MAQTINSIDASLGAVTDQQLGLVRDGCTQDPKQTLLQAVDAAGLLSPGADDGGAEPGAKPTPSGQEASAFSRGVSDSVTVKDVNGYSAIVTMRMSKWTPMQPSQAATQCSAEELAAADGDSSVVYGRQIEIEAKFPDTAQGDWSNGGAALLAAYSSIAGKADAKDGEVVCRPDTIHDGDSYGYGTSHYMLFDVSPEVPTSSMTVYRIVAKTPANPRGEREGDGLPRGSVTIAGHNHPDSVQDGMLTGRRDDFEKYQKVGYLGDDGFGRDIPHGGTLDN